MDEGWPFKDQLLFILKANDNLELLLAFMFFQVAKMRKLLRTDATEKLFLHSV